MSLSTRQFRILLILQVVLGIVAIAVNFMFPELVPASILDAFNQFMLSRSRSILIGIVIAAIVLFIMGLVAVFALYSFRHWGRVLAIIVTLLDILLKLVFGLEIHSGVVAVFTNINNALWGFTLALIYFSPLREEFEKKSAQQSQPIYPELPVENEQVVEDVSEADSTSETRLPSSSNRPLLALFANIRLGLRGFFFLPFTLKEENVNWTQLLLLVAALPLTRFAGDFLHIGMHGHFAQYGMSGALFDLPILLLAGWALALLARRSDKTLALLVVLSAIDLCFCAVQALLLLSYYSGGEDWQDIINPLWVPLHKIGVIWFVLASSVATIRLFGMPARTKFFVPLLTILLIGMPLWYFHPYRTLWEEPYDAKAAEAQRKLDNLLNTEDLFYLQPKLLEQELAAIKPGNKDDINLFFVGMAGYADQDVFMKEIHYVNNLFQQRFDTAGHSAILINNPKTVRQTPIADGTSLQMTLKQIGAVMNPDKDILFLYMTSHGSHDHKFSLDFGSMEFNDLDPKRLRSILDASGIKRRVIVIAACYSGGFIDALKNENTIVMTSAAPDKTSFGCSNEEEFTYFGKAYFNQALRKTDSFIDAFNLAKPLIAAREKADKYEPSDPRIFVGDAIKTALDDFGNQQSARHHSIKDGYSAVPVAGVSANVPANSIPQ